MGISEAGTAHFGSAIRSSSEDAVPVRCGSDPPGRE